MRRIGAYAGAAAGLLLSVACSVRTVEPADRFEGMFSTGFEVAAFRPCGSEEVWWVTGGEELFRRYRELGVPDYAEVYAVVRGSASEPGEYGHLGAYDREIEVAEVVEVDPQGGC